MCCINKLSGVGSKPAPTAAVTRIIGEALEPAPIAAVTRMMGEATAGWVEHPGTGSCALSSARRTA